MYGGNTPDHGFTGLMCTMLKKLKPREIVCRSYKKFDQDNYLHNMEKIPFQVNFVNSLTVLMTPIDYAVSLLET